MTDSTRNELDLAEINRQVGMMQDPDRWPLWPYLPLKRYRPRQDGSFDLESAYLYDVGVMERGQVTRNEVDVTMHLRSGPGFAPKTDEQVEFVSFTQIVNDGWLGD